MKKKKVVQRLLVMLMVLAMSISVFADSSSAVREDYSGVLQINLTYTSKEGVKMVIGGGSGFLISDSYVLTCYHVVNFDETYDNYDDVVDFFGSDFDKDKIKIEVVVMDDVVREATLTTSYSETNDFAVLQLRESINGKKPLQLGKQETVVETDNVYALGFPDAIANFQNENTYDESDVTLTDGKVNKFITTDGVNYIQHSAKLSSGSSGGPLVNDAGIVVGLNAGKLWDNDYYLSISMDRIISILDANSIPYTLATSDIQTQVQKPAETQAESDESNEATVAVADKQSDEAEKPTTEKPSNDIEEPANNSNILIIVAIAAVAVVVIVIIIIIIVATSGRNKKNVPIGPISAAPAQGGYGAPQAPQVQASSMVNGYIPPAPKPACENPEGAGETTVLSEGAGETTVLGGGAQAAVRVIIRVKTGERINIAKPEILLGKERVRVDYCITNNNSVSRTHAKLLNRNGQLSIIDMNATNGTYVNGSKLTPNKETVLKSGDRFKLADEEFLVQ